MTRELLARDQVARKLGHGKVWFSKNRKALEAGNGFPPAVLGRGRGARWDPAAIDAWLDARMPPALRAETRVGLDPDWEARLIERLPRAAGAGQ